MKRPVQLGGEQSSDSRPFDSTRVLRVTLVLTPEQIAQLR